MSEKRRIRVTLTSWGAYCFPNTAQSLIEELQSLKNEYGEVYLDSDYDNSWGSERDFHLTAYTYREETDKEYNARIDREELQKRDQEALERKQYEQLHEKFGDKK